MEEILGVLPQEAMSVLDQRLEKKTTCRVFSCQWWAMGVSCVLMLVPSVSLLPAGRPYRGKPSDMWALGVVLFTMLYGQFPFYDSIPQELFRKIKAAEYTIPE